MLIVHHLKDSRSQSILWLLEELGKAYHVAPYQRDPKTRLAPAELKKIHPLGKSPVITDEGLTIAETGLIFEYLCDRYGDRTLAPQKSAGADSPERLRWLYWLHYCEGSAMPPLLLNLVFKGLPAEAVAEVQAGFVDPQVKLHVDYWETELAKTGWFAGEDFSAADVIMGFPVGAAANRLGLGTQHPNIQDFLARAHVRPAYQRALAKGAI